MVSKKTATLCANFLVIVAFLFALLSVMIASCGKQIDTHETLAILGYPKKIGVLKYVLIGVMVLTFIFSLLLRLLMNKNISKFTMFFLVFALVAFFLVGNKLTLVYGLTAPIVETNCALLQANKTVGSTDPQMKEMFAFVAQADAIIASGPNLQMCSSKCPCQGDDSSPQYKAYMHDAHESILNDGGRTKVGSDK